MRNRAGAPLEEQVFYRSKNDATLFSVRDAMEHVRATLKQRAVDDVTLSSIEIVVTEVLNNIVEHALTEGSGWFELSCEIKKNELSFHIEDNGLEMPLGRLPEGIPPETHGPRCSLPEGGWGWSLVHTLANDLRYQRNGSINHVRFTISRIKPS